MLLRRSWRSVDRHGTAADCLCAHVITRFRCTQCLRLIGVTCQAELAAGAGTDLRDFAAAAAPLAGTPEAGMGLYTEAARKLGPRLLAPLTDLLAAVGQAHLLRRRIATELRNLSRHGPWLRWVHLRSACTL